jgi:hypothetical protein
MNHRRDSKSFSRIRKSAPKSSRIQKRRLRMKLRAKKMQRKKKRRNLVNVSMALFKPLFRRGIDKRRLKRRQGSPECR